MTMCSGKSSLFGLLCVSFVNVNQVVREFLSVLGLKTEMLI